MGATIKCNQTERHAISQILLERLKKVIEQIDEDENCVSVYETEEGLSIDYPTGEIYGRASDYVQAIPNVFIEIKKKYPEIEVRGIAYEYETVSEATFGPFFYCKTTDSDLTVTYKWQICESCGSVIEKGNFL